MFVPHGFCSCTTHHHRQNKHTPCCCLSLQTQFVPQKDRRWELGCKLVMCIPNENFISQLKSCEHCWVDFEFHLLPHIIIVSSNVKFIISVCGCAIMMMAEWVYLCICRLGGVWVYIPRGNGIEIACYCQFSGVLVCHDSWIPWKPTKTTKHFKGLP